MGGLMTSLAAYYLYTLIYFTLLFHFLSTDEILPLLFAFEFRFTLSTINSLQHFAYVEKILLESVSLLAF